MALVQKRLDDLKRDQPQLQRNFSASNQWEHSIEASTLPKGFPTSVKESLAWDGSKLDSNLTNVYSLTAADVIELDSALAMFKTYQLDGDLVERKNFPLPSLQHVLKTSRDELHTGKGFFVLRGLNPNKYSVEDCTIIFFGIQSYIAELKARQDDKGNMIVHIISDTSAASSSTKVFHSRHSKSSIAFHTEETGDVIAWQTRSIAARGGKCIISSAYTIYNVLAATRPDIVRTLARSDWPFALPHFHCRPILFYHDNHLIINFCRAALIGSSAHPRSSQLPKITPQQLEALDAVESIARATQLELATRAGDMHFINNMAVLHRRDEFVDDETDITKKRHLVRMRLKNEQLAWKIPEQLKEEQDGAFDEEGERVWHIEPMPEAFFPLRKYML